MVESEQSTSDSLLNPWGKAHIPNLPNGVWIDIEDNHNRKRCILTVMHVLLVTPEPKSTTPREQKQLKRRLSILQRVDSAAPQVTLMIAGKNDARDDLAAKIWAEAQLYLD